MKILTINIPAAPPQVLQKQMRNRATDLASPQTRVIMPGNKKEVEVRNKSFALIVVAVLCAMFPAGGQERELSAERMPIVGGPLRTEAGEGFSFAILGDKTSGGEGQWPVYDRAVDGINLLAPDFVITTGDHIPGHMEDRAQWNVEWAEYLEHARRLRAPLILIPGNHDIANTVCHKFWKDDFGVTYFRFMYGDCLFLVLNTEEERFDGRGPVWEKMMVFAEDTLREQAVARHTFLFFHKPMWADPRFVKDWARLETALGARPYTAVGGHEHYLSTEKRGDNLLIIQNAVGGGIGLSDVKEIGCFHAFTHVKVTERGVSYAVIEPEGGIWAPETAPAWFRHAVNHQTVKLDADMPEGLGSPEVFVKGKMALTNSVDQPITVRVEIDSLEASGWVCESAGVVEAALEPGQSRAVPLQFRVPAGKLATPPAIRHSVLYKGNWLEAEPMRMERVDVAPLYPQGAWRDVPRWQVAGPFPLGPIDTSKLPADPAGANPSFFRRFGPEDGFEPGRTYDGGVGWRTADSCGNGLLNHNAILGTADLAAAYSACAVFSPGERLTHAVVYADNFAQVFVNGELVESAQVFGAPGGFVYVPIELRQGWNWVVVKVINNRGDWFLRFLLADPALDLRLNDQPL